MFYKSYWAAFFYYLPLQRMTNPPLIYPQIYNNFSSYNNYNRYNSTVDDCLVVVVLFNYYIKNYF